jgi:hypothetical protein
MAEEKDDLRERKITINSVLLISILSFLVVFIINLILFVTEKGGAAIPFVLIVFAGLIVVMLLIYIIIDILKIYKKKAMKNIE